jgi:septal ring factor EnvC (AmiA/AmiB activator)
MADYPTSEEIARLKEARELRREQIRDLTKVKDKTAEQEALLAKLKTEHQNIGKQLREQLEIRKELNADLREEILALEGLAKILFWA